LRGLAIIEAFAMSVHDAEPSLDTLPTSDLGAFSIKQFAAMFSLSHGMIYKLRNEGKLRIAKAGNKSIITATEARRFQSALDADAT
jgi:hypothetical protein